MRRVEVTPGDEYGDLQVIRELASSGKRRFLCRCTCGSEVEVRLGHLRSGHTASCGRCGIEWNGQRKTLREWAKEYKINESTLRARLRVMGMGEAIRLGGER
jgi:hypothetical protein